MKNKINVNDEEIEEYIIGLNIKPNVKLVKIKWYYVSEIITINEFNILVIEKIKTNKIKKELLSFFWTKKQF